MLMEVSSRRHSVRISRYSGGDPGGSADGRGDCVMPVMPADLLAPRPIERRPPPGSSETLQRQLGDVARTSATLKTLYRAVDVAAFRCRSTSERATSADSRMPPADRGAGECPDRRGPCRRPPADTGDQRRKSRNPMEDSSTRPPPVPAPVHRPGMPVQIAGHRGGRAPSRQASAPAVSVIQSTRREIVETMRRHRNACATRSPGASPEIDHFT